MSLKTGIYTIRWVPKDTKLPSVGGMYATADAQREHVSTKALVPGVGNQKWNVMSVEGKENTYYINYPGITLAGGKGPYNEDTYVTSWSSKRKPEGDDVEPVILGSHLEEWVITIVDEEHGVYRIAEPHDEVVGAGRYVTDRNNLLYVGSYPIMLDDHLPSWQFTLSSD